LLTAPLVFAWDFNTKDTKGEKDTKKSKLYFSISYPRRRLRVLRGLRVLRVKIEVARSAGGGSWGDADQEVLPSTCRRGDLQRG
jgi:hypothetical protein